MECAERQFNHHHQVVGMTHLPSKEMAKMASCFTNLKLVGSSYLDEPLSTYIICFELCLYTSVMTEVDKKLQNMSNLEKGKSMEILLQSIILMGFNRFIQKIHRKSHQVNHISRCSHHAGCCNEVLRQDLKWRSGCWMSSEIPVWQVVLLRGW